MGLVCGLNFCAPAPFALGKVIPHINHFCTLSAWLAVGLYSRLIAFAFSNDVEME